MKSDTEPRQAVTGKASAEQSAPGKEGIGFPSVKQFRSAGDTKHDRAARAVQQFPQSNGVIQGAFEFEKFSDDDEKFQLLKVLVQSNDNKYLQFFRSKWGRIIIRLDDSNDKNPGTASKIYLDTKEGKWKHTDVDELRTKDSIDGLGAIITIRKWYYDKYSVGQLLSMAAHEIGVHIVPYMDEMVAKLPKEAQEKNGFYPPKDADTSKQPGRMGIIDHTRVADVRHEDFALYRDVVNSIVRGTLKYMKFKLKEGQGEQIAEDLTDAYLMDISTFQADGSRWVVPRPKQIADSYNRYAVVKRPPLDRLPVLKKTQGDVLGDYLTLYKNVVPTAAAQHWVITIILVCAIIYLAKLFLQLL